MEVDRDPFDEIIALAGIYPIYTLFFMQVGLKIPFDPLLANFLYKTRLHVAQLSPNTVKIILRIAKLNRCYGLNLEFHNIRYCYNLGASKKDKKWNLKARVQSPSLVEALPDSHKYMYNDIIIILTKGNVEPGPVNKPVPRQFGASGLYL